MTNLIGAALIIISINVQTNYCTNLVSITCEQAGCTNHPGRPWIHSYDYGKTWITNSETGWFHTSNAVYAVSEMETVTMGSDGKRYMRDATSDEMVGTPALGGLRYDNSCKPGQVYCYCENGTNDLTRKMVMNNGKWYEIMSPIPMYDIITHRPLPDAQKETMVWRKEGTWIRRITKP